MGKLLAMLIAAAFAVSTGAVMAQGKDEGKKDGHKAAAKKDGHKAAAKKDGKKEEKKEAAKK